MDLNHTNCPNRLTARIVLTDSQSTAVVALMAILMLVIIITNVFLGYMMFITKQLNSRGRWYMFFLTVADGLYGATSLPLAIILLSKYKSIRFCALEYATIFVAQFMANMSAYFTTLIAFHRYLKISPNLKNHTYGSFKHSLMSGKVANCVVALCVISPILHGLFSTHIFGYSKSIWPNIIMKGASLIIFIATYVLYFKVYYNVTKKRPTVTASETHQRIISRGSPKQPPSYTKEFTKTVFLILVSLAVNYMPMIIIDLWITVYRYFKGEMVPPIAIFLHYMSWAQVSTIPFFDSMIFIYQNRKVREHISAWRLKFIRRARPTKSLYIVNGKNTSSVSFAESFSQSG